MPVLTATAPGPPREFLCQKRGVSSGFWDQFWDQGSPRPFCTNVAQLDQDKAARHDSIVQFPQILAPQRLHLPSLKSVRRQIIWPVGFQFLATAKSSADEVCGLPRVLVLVQFHGILMVLTPSRPYPCPHPCLTLSAISWRGSLMQEPVRCGSFDAQRRSPVCPQVAFLERRPSGLGIVCLWKQTFFSVLGGCASVVSVCNCPRRSSARWRKSTSQQHQQRIGETHGLPLVPLLPAPGAMGTQTTRTSQVPVPQPERNLLKSASSSSKPPQQLTETPTQETALSSTDSVACRFPPSFCLFQSFCLPCLLFPHPSRSTFRHP